MRLAVVGAALALPLCAGAAAAELTCGGVEPDWRLDLAEDSAVFDFLRDGTFEVPQMSMAKGADLPRAYTLIADFDTAIVIVADGPCSSGDLRAHVLTQQGTEPVILTGCCTGTPP